MNTNRPPHDPTSGDDARDDAADANDPVTPGAESAAAITDDDRELMRGGIEEL